MDTERLIPCEKCGESGEDPNGPYQNCPHCAGTGAHPRLIHAEASEQFDSNCIVIESLEANPDDVMEWAEEIDAIYVSDDRYYVVDFQVDERRVGPETYTERALLSTLKAKPTAA